MTEFERFFEEDWNRMLDNLPSRSDLFSNGSSLRDASWDRKAAYLAWCATRTNATAREKPQPHVFESDAKHPFFCKHCGYGPGEMLRHIQPDEFDIL